MLERMNLRMRTRTTTKQIKVGDVVIGGQNKVVIQSMCNTKTKDVEATVKQIIELENAGCEIIRVACLELRIFILIIELL